MKYLFYYTTVALIFSGILSCTEPKGTLYKGTPVDTAAKAIVEKDHNALRAWAAEAPAELLNFQGKIPLNLYAYRRGNMEAVKILTEAGADPNLQSSAGISAFLSSCSAIPSMTDNSMMVYLLANGGNPNSESSRYTHRTPLIMASRTNLKNVKLLVNAGADTNYTLKHSEGTIESPLLTALMYKRIHITNYYIFEKGMDYRIVDKPSMKEGIPPQTILTFLRRMPFKPGTEEHTAKWKLINHLKKEGLDYKKQPIPEFMLNQFDKEFLDAY